MTLLKVKRANDYTDFYLGWTFNNKKYFVRVRPVFPVDLDKFFAIAINVEDGDNLDKYL